MKKILNLFAGLTLLFSFSLPALAEITAISPQHALLLQNAGTLQPATQVATQETPAPAPAPTPKPLTVSPMLRTDLKTTEQRAAEQKAAEENKKKGLLQTLFSDYGLQIIALVLSVIGIILAVSGFSMASAKKKKHISRFMNEIDDAFHSFKWKSKRCEAELYRLHDQIEEKLKDGKLDESSYQLLSARIEKYIKEIQEIDKLPEHLKHDRPTSKQDK